MSSMVHGVPLRGARPCTSITAAMPGIGGQCLRTLSSTWAGTQREASRAASRVSSAALLWKSSAHAPTTSRVRSEAFFGSTRSASCAPSSASTDENARSSGHAAAEPCRVDSMGRVRSGAGTEACALRRR